jgi:hypothetical protein
MRRPHGKHLRLAERAAYDSGARNIEWKQGTKHWKMVVTLPDGRTVTELVGRNMTPYFQGHLADWIRQRMRQEMRKEGNR